MRWRVGYNTNGFQSHRLLDALKVMAEIGYSSAAITLDHCHLDPFRCAQQEINEVKAFLRNHSMECTIETGGRYLLDPWKKHYPTLISEGRENRIQLLKKAIDIGSQLEAQCLSFFSGVPEEGKELDVLFDRLSEGIDHIASFARDRGVVLALEPEPGMLVESITDYLYVKQITNLSELKLTLDIGHIQCTEKISIPQALHSYASEIANIHIADIRSRVHEHLPFGEGDINFTPVFKALNKIGPAFPIHVELSRSSHRAPEVAREAFGFLKTNLH